MHPNAQINLLNRFLEIVKVALPDGWHLSAVDGGGSRRSRPSSSKSNHSGGGGSVAKQFGTFGKKLKKNLGRLARDGGAIHSVV